MTKVRHPGITRGQLRHPGITRGQRRSKHVWNLNGRQNMLVCVLIKKLGKNGCIGHDH
jgi:hypothetical protein